MAVAAEWMTEYRESLYHSTREYRRLSGKLPYSSIHTALQLAVSHYFNKRPNK